MKGKKTERIARLGFLTAVGLIASYIELLVPIPLGIPGVKLGLANMVIVWTLYVGAFGSTFGKWDADCAFGVFVWKSVDDFI